MSHIHLPDGILPVTWWLLGYVLVFVILYILLNRMKKYDIRTRIPRAAMAAAFMLVAMSVPIGIIPIHFSMAVLAGILVGPGPGFLAVFVVNVILALVGHGGITIVGLNTLVIGAEVFVGTHLFNYLSSYLTKAKAAFCAVFPAIVISMALMVGIIGATVSFAEAVPVHQHDHGNDHGHDHGHEVHDYEESHEGHQVEELYGAVKEVHYFTLSGWSALGIILLVGLFLESGITSLIVRYISIVKPDLIYNNDFDEELEE